MQLHSRSGVNVAIMEPCHFTLTGLSWLVQESFTQCRVMIECTDTAGLISQLKKPQGREIDLLITETHGRDENPLAWLDFLHYQSRCLRPVRTLLYTNNRPLRVLNMIADMDHITILPKQAPLEDVRQILQTTYHTRAASLQGFLGLHRKKLTHAERSILKMILAGKTQASIASRSGLSVKTISNHKHNALRKMGVKNLAQLFICLGCHDEQKIEQVIQSM